MTEAFESIADAIVAYKDGDHVHHPFFHFEPWDVEKRTDEQIKIALEDGIDLYSQELTRHFGTDPHKFQTGYMMSTKFIRGLLAGSQAGKSRAALIENGIQLSGEIPISMRFPKGHVTDVKRIISEENIRRWGRHDSKTGELIDYDTTAQLPEGWSEWDCGCIEGVGIYPEEKIAPPGSEIRIGTYQRAMLETWWPYLTDPNKAVYPEHFFDRNRGNKGVNVKDRIINMARGCRVVVITYESGSARFEALEVFSTVLDEEPPGNDGYEVFQSAQQHTKYLSVVETPYLGITWSKKILMPESKSAEVEVFHATQFDSPYRDNERVMVMRKNMEAWQRGARIWGIPTEATGSPYFDRNKINYWIQKYQYPCKYFRFTPTEESHGILDTTVRGMKLQGLLSTPVTAIEMPKENRMDVWRVYEDKQEGVGYILIADPAEGAENPDEAGDLCAAQIWRDAFESEEDQKPRLVAALDSTLLTIHFARTCSYAMRYYNNAVCSPECAKRGAANASFTAELNDWPYWYRMTTLRESTQKTQEVRGFDMTGRVRDSIFNLISDWLSEYGSNEHPRIPDKPLLEELSAAVVGKGGRCDHTKTGTLDRAVCFGIFLYVWKHARHQIVCNEINSDDRRAPWSKIAELLNRNNPKQNTNGKWLGSNLPNWRN